MENYAKSLPLELKIKILINLPYKTVMFITDHYFWIRYWDNYNKQNICNGSFQPNPEQEYVLELIKAKKNVFINAPAGTGKSTLIKYLSSLTVNDHFNPKTSKEIIGITSTTGISALNIGGSTLHSFLGIGLGKENMEDLYDKIIKNKDKRELWLNLNILIIVCFIQTFLINLKE
jgi:ATP-dependent DNA helicase PIF1